MHVPYSFDIYYLRNEAEAVFSCPCMIHRPHCCTVFIKHFIANQICTRNIIQRKQKAVFKIHEQQHDGGNVTGDPSSQNWEIKDCCLQQKPHKRQQRCC